jgi:hypothetical protein
MTKAWLWLAVTATLVACTAAPPVDSAPPGLGAEALLVRATLDLRGTRPTADALRQVREHPSRVEAMLDALVDDSRIYQRVRAIFAAAFRTRIDSYPYEEELFGEAGRPQSFGDEPADLAAYLAVNDLPFSELVRADYTVASDGLVGIWPLEPAANDGEWTPPGTSVMRYTDGRPHSGVLSMNTLWWRHQSTVENANRGRANALSQAVLCQNYLDRPIEFPRDIDLTDSESIRNAIRQNAACTACHATMDPMASYLWGFMYLAESPSVWSVYHPAQERDWVRHTQRPPGFFGTPGWRLEDLGNQIAGDPRFVMCVVRRVTASFLGRPLELADDGALAAHREAFVQSNLSLRAMIRSVIRQPAYRGVTARSPYGGVPAAVPLKLVSPATLGDQLEHLTGYRIRFEGQDLLSFDRGLRALAGGSARGPAVLPSTGLSLVQRRLAEGAARTVFLGETEGLFSPILDDADLDAPPTAETIAALLLTTSRFAGPEEVAAQQGLWSDVYRVSGDRQDAWIAMLSALLADPDLLLY